MEQKVVIDGYEFQNPEDAKIANEELAKVNALHSKIDENNLAAVKAVYIKAVEQNIFETQIGLTYLKNIRNYLVSKGVLKENEAPIPVLYTKSILKYKSSQNAAEFEALKQKLKNDAEQKIQTEKMKTEKVQKSCRQRTILCAVLFCMVLLMFAISMTGNNPTILNYKSAILNQYAEWEQQLTERENKIREKEAELGILDENSQK